MKKILIIEDNESNRDLLSFLLEHSRFEVVTATDGVEGVETAVKERPDLILMDIQMPNLDGLKATRKIRENQQTKDIPIIAVTSYVMPGDREKILSAGCNGYIGKPIDTDTIVDEIKKYL